MDRNLFIETLKDAVQTYIDNFDRFDSNPQIMVNPSTLNVNLVDGKTMISSIEDSDEAIEDAAFADGAETEEATDFQVKRNPDFYPVKKMLKPVSEYKSVPSIDELNKIAANYFTEK